MHYGQFGDSSPCALLERIAQINAWDASGIKRRSMFASFQYFRTDVVFFKVFDDQIYLRISEDMVDQWIKLGSKPCPNLNAPKDYAPQKPASLAALASGQMSGGRQRYGNRACALVRDFWYSVPSSVDTLEELAEAVMHSYVANKAVDEQKRANQKLRSLPNITLSINRMLKAVGIKTVSQLKAIGCCKVYHEIRGLYPNAPLDVLYSLYGAINNTHYCAVPKSVKRELAGEYNAIRFGVPQERVETECATA